MLYQLRRLVSLLALLVGLAQGPNALDAAEVALAWDPSPDEWVTGYAIHYGTTSGVHPVRVDVGNVTNAVIDGLQPGVTYYFVATAYTADGLESDPSNEVSYTVPNPQPDPTNAPPSVNAGPDQTVRLPSVLALTGQVSDDGLPSEPGQLTVWWELVSGPGGVNWSTTNGLSVEVAFAEPGQYVLRLVASDGELSAFDEVTVWVEPPLPVNQAPVVEAGSDQTIRLPEPVLLSGQVSDDGLPAELGQLTVWWELVSGPAGVNWSTTNGLSVEVAFAEPGQYVLRLVASDGELSAFDEVTVWVEPPLPVNQAPVVEAGLDRTIRLPEPVLLSGQVSDDGLPAEPGQLTVWWELVSGPGLAAWSNTNSLSVLVAFTEPGLYVLRLSASDGELTAADEVRVEVQPSGPANEAPRVSAGWDQTVDWGDPVVLRGGVRDDGLPEVPGRVTVEWQVMSGPGQVNFARPQEPNTEASFSEPGDYVLRLVASDGESTAWDEVTIRILPPPPADQFALVWEAEEGETGGTASSQFSGQPDSPANAAAYVQGSSLGGSVSWTIPVPEDGQYVVWIRGLATDGSGAQLDLVVDGTSQLQGRVVPLTGASWEWMPLLVAANGSFAPPAGGLPKLAVSLAGGTRTLTLRLPDSRLLVDKVLLAAAQTGFSPAAPGAAPAGAPRFVAARLKPDRMQVVWETLPGAVYRVLYKDRWDDPRWQVASPGLMASGEQIVWKDRSAVGVPSRFYRLERLY